jgi:hypothetical protein
MTLLQKFVGVVLELTSVHRIVYFSNYFHIPLPPLTWMLKGCYYSNTWHRAYWTHSTCWFVKCKGGHHHPCVNQNCYSFLIIQNSIPNITKILKNNQMGMKYGTISWICNIMAIFHCPLVGMSSLDEAITKVCINKPIIDCIA